MQHITGTNKEYNMSKIYYVLMRKFYNNTKVLDVFKDIDEARAAHRKLAVDTVFWNNPNDATILESSYEHYVAIIEKK